MCLFIGISCIAIGNSGMQNNSGDPYFPAEISLLGFILLAIGSLSMLYACCCASNAGSSTNRDEAAARLISTSQARKNARDEARKVEEGCRRSKILRQQQERERMERRQRDIDKQERERLKRRRQTEEGERKAVAATTTPSAPRSQLLQLLFDLELTQYEQTLDTLGYDHIDCFDLFSQQNCMSELVHKAKMKKPHARKLIKALKVIHLESMGMSLAGSDHLNLPVATEVYRV